MAPWLIRRSFKCMVVEGGDDTCLSCGWRHGGSCLSVPFDTWATITPHPGVVDYMNCYLLIIELNYDVKFLKIS
jgi:hypothetical protein